MKVLDTPIAGAFVVETTPFTDHRGLFFRCFCERELLPVLGSRQITQINFSRTLAVGTVRGLHFQHPPHAEMKLIRCLKGRVWDVTVDLRAGSPTFLKWHGEELTPGNARMMVIPEGCAHGFQVLEEGSELLYLHTGFYAAPSEGGVCCSDPRLAIAWPLPIADWSEKDRSYASLSADFSGIVL